MQHDLIILNVYEVNPIKVVALDGQILAKILSCAVYDDNKNINIKWMAYKNNKIIPCHA